MLATVPTSACVTDPQPEDGLDTEARTRTRLPTTIGPSAIKATVSDLEGMYSLISSDRGNPSSSRAERRTRPSEDAVSISVYSDTHRHIHTCSHTQCSVKQKLQIANNGTKNSETSESRAQLRTEGSVARAKSQRTGRPARLISPAYHACSSARPACACC